MMDSFFGIGTAASRMTLKASKRPEHTKEGGSHPRRQALHHQHYTRRTLGMDFLHQAVVLPPGQEREEWLAIHVLDFYETLSLLVRIVQDDDNRPRLDPGWGFPPGYEYLWVDTATRKPIKCAGPDYIDHVLRWVEGVVNDMPSGPSGSGSGSMSGSYPRDFEKTVKAVFKRFFRIFAILYTHHYQTVEEMGAVAHMNTAFKHFMFFSFEFDLVPQQEMEAIDMLVARMRHEYFQQGGHSPAAPAPAPAAPEASSLNPPSSPSSPLTPSSVVVHGR